MKTFFKCLYAAVVWCILFGIVMMLMPIIFNLLAAWADIVNSWFGY